MRPTADHADGLTATAEFVRGQEAERTGRRGVAREHYERALTALTAERAVSGGAEGTPAPSLDPAVVLRRIAFTYQVDLDLDAAEDCAMSALAVSEARGDEAGVGHATNLLAIVQWRRGRLDEAERLYLAARSSARRSGDIRLAAMIAQNLGIMANMAGDLRGALRFYHTSLADYRALGLSSEMLRALSNLGMLYKDLERWEAANRAYAEAIEIGTLSGELSTLITVHLNVASLWIARGNLERAAESAARADEIVAGLDDHHADGERARLAGVLARENGAFAESEAFLRSAIDLATRQADLLLEGEAMREMGELFRRQGRNREALQALTHAHRMFSQLRSRREVADVERRNAKLEADFLEVVQRWGASVEAKDHNTQGHCERVSDLACRLAVRAGIPRESMFWFQIGALLHDVGKLVVPSDVLNKPGRLTPAEWEMVRQHPMAGVSLLSEVDFPGDVIPIVRSHHEKWAGGGYPDNLVGEQIPLSARIVSIADVYDALTSVRSYQGAYTHVEAMEIMRRDVGRGFDPSLFAMFEALMAEGEPARATPPRALPRVATPELAVGDEADDLTGVLTRRAFVDVVHASLDGRVGTAPAALLVLDIDLFKRVNDTFGHLCGDDVLRAVASAVEGCVEGRGVVGRFAGDEFVVWLAHADEADARSMADVIREAVQRTRVPARDTTTPLAVTVSIGVAAAPFAGRTFDELFAAADRAMYEAKRAGRNRTSRVVDAPASTEFVIADDRFVGRGPELEQLTLLLDDTLRRQPRLLLLSGDAGVGKTTLIRQLGAAVRLRGGTFVCGQCFETDLRPPYSAWIDALGALVAAHPVSDRPWHELGRLLPSLGAPRGEAPPSKYALYEEVTELLRQASADQPVTLVLEDMQWADAAAWDLLEHVQSRLSNERVLIALTLRQDGAREMDRDRLARLARDERLRAMRLEPLNTREVQTWLEAVLDRTDLPAELVTLVQERAEGNPLLVHHLLRAMIESHAVWHDGTRWRWRLPLEVPRPASAYELFARRVERLSPSSRRVLAVAAVIGRRFDVNLLIEASGWDEDDVVEAMDEGTQAGVLEPLDGPEVNADAELYAFSHAMLHDVLRRVLHPRRARRLHERIARALERRDPRAVAELAKHYDRAGNAARAYEHAMRAGQAAADVHATDDAIAFFESAARHATTSDQKFRAYQSLIRVAERTGAYARCESFCATALEQLEGELAPADRLWLMVQRARVDFFTGATPVETLRTCDRLAADAARLGRQADQAAIAILQSRALARTGEFGAAEAAAAAAVDQARAAGDEALEILAIGRHGSMILERDPRAALETFSRGLDLAVRLGDAHAEARARINLGVACARSQRNDAAEMAYETARVLADRIHAPDLAGLAALNHGVLRLHAGRYGDAREQLAAAVSLFTIVQNEPHRMFALYNAASVERECGNALAAADLYVRTRDAANALGARDVALGAAAGAGLAAVRLGRLETARVTARALRAEISNEGDRWFQGREMIEALLIRVALDAGDVAGAERAFWAALSLAEAHDQYAAAWLTAEVVTELVDAGCIEAGTAAARYAETVAAQGYAGIAARYVALKDLADRTSIAYGAVA